jgi:hypothetical protein
MRTEEPRHFGGAFELHATLLLTFRFASVITTGLDLNGLELPNLETAIEQPDERGQNS